MEMNQETLERMRQMRLLGMYNAFKTSLEAFRTDSMTTDQFISWMVCNEWDDRRNRLIERLIRQASFRYKSSVEEINFNVERGLDRNQFQRLAELTFVREHKDLFITGSTVPGKVIWPHLLAMRPARKG